MCFRHGDRGFPDLRSLDMNRRSLMRRAAEGALVVGLGGGLLGAVGNALADTGIKATHGTGFCNLALFLAHARQIAAEDDVALEFVNAPTFADHVTFLATGAVDVSVLPYTSFVALHGAGAPVKIVAGGGIEGCVIVAQPGLDSAEELKGKTLGTFQLDTLEVLPYDYLKANGVGFDEVVVRYMGSTPEAVEAFKAGALLDLHHRALRHGAARNHARDAQALRRHRHLRQGLRRLRPWRPRQPDPRAARDGQGADQGDDEGAVLVRDRAGGGAGGTGRGLLRVRCASVQDATIPST